MNSRATRTRMSHVESLETRDLMTVDTGDMVTSAATLPPVISTERLPVELATLASQSSAEGTALSDAAAVDPVLNSGLADVTAVDETLPQADLCPALQRLAGDANSDGLFDSQDLIRVFQAGKYESGQTASWDEGDFDGNGIFDSSDLIAALQTGSFEGGFNELVSPETPVSCSHFDNNVEISLTQDGSRKATHRIGRADGGWTDEYTDYDRAGKRIGRSSETYDKGGVMREKTTTRTDAMGGRTTTRETYDKDAKWTGTTSETYDKNGALTGGTKSTPDGKDGTTTQTYDPATGTWK